MVLTDDLQALAFTVTYAIALDYILSLASEAGSLTNRLGSGQRQDTDQGPFSPSTDGLDLTLMHM